MPCWQGLCGQLLCISRCLDWALAAQALTTQGAVTVLPLPSLPERRLNTRAWPGRGALSMRSLPGVRINWYQKASGPEVEEKRLGSRNLKSDMSWKTYLKLRKQGDLPEWCRLRAKQTPVPAAANMPRTKQP